jgi:hypothetical protein
MIRLYTITKEIQDIVDSKYLLTQLGINDPKHYKPSFMSYGSCDTIMISNGRIDILDEDVVRFKFRLLDTNTIDEQVYLVANSLESLINCEKQNLFSNSDVCYLIMLSSLNREQLLSDCTRLIINFMKSSKEYYR